MKYVYPWILDAIRRKDWTSEGVKTFTDLLHKTFGKANRGSYHSRPGLAIAMSALQALAEKYGRLPTYRIIKKEACGILKAIEREEWLTEDVLTYNDLLQKTFGEVNRLGGLVTP
ncbi:MAG: hypothetical protein ACFFC7_01965 [Candidatus Hermodarchaeota archaeon]